MGSMFFHFTGLEMSLDDNSVLSKPNGKPADMSAVSSLLRLKTLQM